MTRSTTARSTAARIHPNSPAAATGVPRTTHDRATGSDHRAIPQRTASHGTFEQLRLW